MTEFVIHRRLDSNGIIVLFKFNIGHERRLIQRLLNFGVEKWRHAMFRDEQLARLSQSSLATCKKKKLANVRIVNKAALLKISFSFLISDKIRLLLCLDKGGISPVGLSAVSCFAREIH